MLQDDYRDNPEISSALLGMIMMIGAGTLLWVSMRKTTKDSREPFPGGVDTPGQHRREGDRLPTTRQTSWSPSSPFPSAQEGNGVSYDDVEAAFSYVQQVAVQMGFSSWPSDAVQRAASGESEVDPALTLSSIKPFQASGWIPASAISPSMYVNQYNRSLRILEHLRQQHRASATQLHVRWV